MIEAHTPSTCFDDRFSFLVNDEREIDEREIDEREIDEREIDVREIDEREN